MKIHPTAIVEDGARLADGVEVGPFCVVGPGSILLEGVRLLSHVTVTGRTEIGPRTVVHPNVVLGGEAQIRKPSPTHVGLRIGADNIIREGVTLSMGSGAGSGTTVIGDRCYLMAYSHVGHDSRVGNDVTLSNGVLLAGHVDIGDGAIFGGLAAMQQFGRVGRCAFISGLSGVSTDVIPYGIAIGLHVRLGGLNLVGLRRRNIPRASIHALRAAYRFIFLDHDEPIHERARQATDKWPGVPEVEEVISFILADAKRPICPARKRGADSDQD
ncbi:MAG: acyl-ACP--UDP-N-acetylglucosamine O-acyltransferase [Rhizomicrobium sp.]|jgi:UDP-N-acetylglucosamine acyltransferase